MKRRSDARIHVLHWTHFVFLPALKGPVVSTCSYYAHKNVPSEEHGSRHHYVVAHHIILSIKDCFFDKQRLFHFEMLCNHNVCSFRD